MKYFNKISENRKIIIILIVLIIITLVPRIVDINTPYETWDEVTTYSIGLNLWYNIIQGDFSPETWKTYSTDYSGSLHPPFARYAYGIVNGVYIFSQTGLDLLSSGYDNAVIVMYNMKSMIPGRLFSAVLAVATSIIIFFTARRFFGLKIAVFAAITFALLPVSLAQTRLAALDVLLVFLYTAAVYTFIKGLESRRHFILSLILTGLCIATKYNSVTLFVLLPIIYLISDKKNIQKKYLLLIPITSIIILFLIWPRFWPDPVGGALTNINGWLSMTSETGVVPEYFLGGLEHPIYYEPTYVFSTMPLLLTIFFIFGIAASIKKNTFGHKSTLLWFVIPLFLYSVFTFRMNGPRYVFMIYPAISILISVGMFWFMDWVRDIKYGNLLYKAIPILTLIYMAVTVISIHPFYLDYYSESVGGPENVYNNKLFAIGQWGDGIGTAAYWLNENADADSTVQFFVMPRHVIPPIRTDIEDLTPFVPKYLSETEENENWVMTDVKPEAKYIVENTYFRFYLNTTFHELISNDYTLIHTVKAEGAPLVWIYERSNRT